MEHPSKKALSEVTAKSAAWPLKNQIFVLLRGRQLDSGLLHFPKKIHFCAKKNWILRSRLHETPIFTVFKRSQICVFFILDFSNIAYFHGFSTIFFILGGQKEVPRRFQGLMETLTYQGTPKETKGSKKHRSWRGWPVTLPQASSIRRILAGVFEVKTICQLP